MIQNNNKNQILKIIIDCNFDVIYNLKKIGNIYFYIVDLYEKTVYKKDDNNLIIYEPKIKFSLSQSKKKDLGPFIPIDNKDEEIKFIKAKTLFNNKSKKDKNFNKYQFGDDKNIIIEKNSNNEDEKEIEKVKTWASDNNSIDMKKHTIKEGERIFNNLDSLIANIKSDKISNNSEGNNKNKNIENKIKRSQIERKTKRIETRKKIKDRYENDNSFAIYNIKNKEEEKISFITKDKFEEYIKKNNSFNFYFIFNIFFLLFVKSIIISIKLVLARTNFSITSYLTNGVIFLEEMKSDLYTGSIIVLSQCYRTNEEDKPKGLGDFSIQLLIKSQDLMSHLNLFEKQIKLSNNINLFSSIMNYLYKNITIYYLNSDWSQRVEQSYFLKEINYFSYLLNEQSLFSNENNKCDFENNFYLLLFKRAEDIYNLNNREETSFNQRFIYYIILNLINTIKPLFRDIVEEIIIVQIKIMNNFLTKIIIINSFLVFLIFINGFIILLKNILDMHFIKYIFLFLYEYNQNQLQFEYEINYLEITAKEFNLNNLIQLENIKKNNYNYLKLIVPNGLNENNNGENNINEEKPDKSQKISMLRESLIKNSIQINKKNNLIENMVNKYQKINNSFDKNSMSSSLFNKSLNNNSMIQLLNKNKDGINNLKNDYNNSHQKNELQNEKNKKRFKNFEINNNIKGFDEEDQIFSNNEETLDLLKSNNKIIPSTIIISIYFSLIFIIVFIFTIILNTIDIKKKRNLWEYGVNLSMNYLDKIPMTIELGLATFLTIILGNGDGIKYYKKEDYPKYQQKFLTYFTTMKNYDKSDLISNNIKDSLFSNELYDIYRMKKNIEFCENDEFFSDYFKQSKYWNMKLNEKNQFCINAALEGCLFFNKWITNLETYFDYVQQLAVAFRDENKYICESGLDLEINLVLQELTHLYIDFNERVKANISLARQKFFENENFIRMLKDMNMPFTFSIGTLFSSTNEDMSLLNKIITNYELIYISITYIIGAFFTIFLIIMISYNGKIKKILVFIGNILKKE